jgi:hypothetical protein
MTMNSPIARCSELNVIPADAMQAENEQKWRFFCAIVCELRKFCNCNWIMCNCDWNIQSLVELQLMQKFSLSRNCDWYCSICLSKQETKIILPPSINKLYTLSDQINYSWCDAIFFVRLFHTCSN